MNSMKSSLRHIEIEQGEKETELRRGLYQSLCRAVYDGRGTKNSTFSVIDVGVGRGELLKYLAKDDGFVLYGVDIEPLCVSVSSQYGDCRVGYIKDVINIFSEVKFCSVVCSHVLEHVDSPHDELENLAKLNAESYVFAVPNPLRPIRLFRALLASKRYDHPEHVHAWGHAEFSALLDRTGYVVDEWYSDRVTVNPFSGKFGLFLTRGMHSLESWLLPKYFPMFSSSIIVRCHLAA